MKVFPYQPLSPDVAHYYSPFTVRAWSDARDQGVKLGPLTFYRYHPPPPDESRWIYGVALLSRMALETW